MRFRLGVLAGFGAGYVLGAQAGRARYEQIQDAWGKLMGTPQAQQLSEDVKTAATRASDTLEQKANEGVAKVTELARGDKSSDTDTDTDGDSDSDTDEDRAGTIPDAELTTPATPITPPGTGTYGSGTTGTGPYGA